MDLEHTNDQYWWAGYCAGRIAEGKARDARRRVSWWQRLLSRLIK